MTIAEAAELVLATARANGATAADVVVARSRQLEVSVRQRALEKVTQAEEKQLGLRVFVGKRSAVAATSDLTAAALREFARETCSLAKVVAEDPFSGFPRPEELARELPQLELFDARVAEMTPEQARALAERAEASALDYDSRIVNSEGAECSAQSAEIWYASTLGFARGYESSAISVSVVPVAKSNSGMQRDYWYSVVRQLDQLEPPEAIGRKAAERALRRLDARSVATCEVPVIFDPETASSLLGHLSQAVLGQAIYRGTSFLVGRLGQKIAPSFVTVVDDARIPAALGSKPFDAEGVETRRNTVVDGGYLSSYLLDSYSARRLGFPSSTGNAGRSVGSAPLAAPTNFYLLPGETPPEELIRSVSRGLYVTNLIGFGVNLTTGDYSRGASGLWIENGACSFAVEEVTVAGNLFEMWSRIEAIGNDLALRRAVAAPTILIGKLTVAGRG
ncbi:MAG: peptidase C69 [Candidatus Binatia bacterium]|nr:MAG: peptidase C69 [Candidatus Binatia bacterium]